ncbi:hypothetical protein [Nocardioides nematodiphilus]|uniref:hypothetical protein n=1 Tax=Nocardioides nematodiphilus TaxID=2849669 RepID=UPI001CDA0918|nr:hypothetical protein [Nocardioides nematodiphilus]MCA1982903.1 hypothetical protein [Nocardioides nematodiphilus]
MKITKKKIAAAVGAGAVAVAAGGVAYAYWTTTGSGTGSASSASSAGAAVTITQDGALTGFTLGDTKTVSVKATNGASSSQNIGNITVSVAAAGGCAADNWAVVDLADSVGTLAGGATSASTDVATLTLKDLSTNQDACKGVTPVLTFTAAAGS